MTDHLLKSVPAEMRPVAGAFHYSFIAVLVIAMRWPDTALPGSMMEGFTIVGDIPSSGVFKPVDQEEASNPEELLRDNERKLGEWGETRPSKQWQFLRESA